MDSEIDLKRKLKLEQAAFYMMTVIGGFMGGYALLRSGFLGAAQTANLISIVLTLFGQDFVQVLLRIGAMVLYGVAIALTRIIPRYTKWDMRLVCIFIDMAGILLLGLIPENCDNVVALYPMFFMLAFQWNAFPGACGYTSASIFSTNNYRQMVMALTDFACKRERAALKKACFFFGSLLFYHFGVALAVIGMSLFGLVSVWMMILPAVAAGLLTELQYVQQKHSEKEAVSLPVYVKAS